MARKSNCPIAVWPDLAGDGAGNFATASSFPTDSRPGWIYASDLNGDGKLDLVLLNFCGTDHVKCASGTITIALGDGGANFSTTSIPLTAYLPSALAIGDLNNDGRLDLNQTTL